MFYNKPLEDERLNETVNEKVNETVNNDENQTIFKQDVDTNINEITNNGEKQTVIKQDKNGKWNASVVNTSETINNRRQQSRNSMNHSLIYTYNSGKKNIVKARKFNLTM